MHIALQNVHGSIVQKEALAKGRGLKGRFLNYKYYQHSKVLYTYKQSSPIHLENLTLFLQTNFSLFEQVLHQLPFKHGFESL